MKQFLAIYLGSPAAASRWERLSPAERSERERAGMAGWNDWGERHAAAIVSHGGPLGRTKRASAAGIVAQPAFMTKSRCSYGDLIALNASSLATAYGSVCD